QPRQASLAPHAISGKNHFGIGMTLELDAGGFELLPKFAEVVNLAVEDDPVAGDRILHGLMPERRKVENRQSPVAQADFQRLRMGFFQQHGTGIIGSPVRERTRGLFQNSRRDLGVTRQDANDAAHLKYLLASLRQVLGQDRNLIRRSYLNASTYRECGKSIESPGSNGGTLVPYKRLFPSADFSTSRNPASRSTSLR